MSDVTVRAAAPKDLDIVVEILDEAAAWLTSRGIEQWPESFSGDSTWRMDRIRSYISEGLTYLAENDEGVIVGTFTLSRDADPQFAHGWPGRTSVGGYLFRMAVRRAIAGNGLGALMLDWAGEEVARWGRPWLRIDVHRHNKALQRYYQRQGFTKVAELTAPDLSVPGRTRGSGVLMQRPTPLGA